MELFRDTLRRDVAVTGPDDVCNVQTIVVGLGALPLADLEERKFDLRQKFLMNQDHWSGTDTHSKLAIFVKKAVVVRVSSGRRFPTNLMSRKIS